MIFWAVVEILQALHCNKRKNIVVGNERALRAKRAWAALHQAVSNEVLTDLNAFAQKRRHFLYVTSIQPLFCVMPTKILLAAPLC